MLFFTPVLLIVIASVESQQTSTLSPIYGIPNEVINVSVVCGNGTEPAIITWTEIHMNHTPVLYYLVQFNTSFSPHVWHTAVNRSSNEPHIVYYRMSPWGNYSFRVVAGNQEGEGPPSDPSPQVCTTPPDTPHINPKGVLGEGDQPNNIIIYWKPLPKIEHNGPGLKYHLTWQSTLIPGHSGSYVEESAEAWSHQVSVPPDTPPYTQYEITVTASNQLGESTAPVYRYIGFTGEDVPEVIVTDLRVDTVTETEADLHWSHVSIDPSVIHGFFTGYRVEYGLTEDWPHHMTMQDVILVVPPYYPPTHNDTEYALHNRRKRSLAPTVMYKLVNLPQNSSLTAHVQVLNKYYAGAPSDTVIIHTLPTVEMTTTEAHTSTVRTSTSTQDPAVSHAARVWWGMALSLTLILTL